MKCPHCGLFNPPEAERCDCGWDFTARTMQASYLVPAAAGAAELATPGLGFTAKVIDAAIAIALLYLGVGIGRILPQLGVGIRTAGIALALCYWLFSDAFRNGQSVGGRLTKTAIVDERTGRPCTYRQSFLRNFFVSSLTGGRWAVNAKQQTFGDSIAGTLVIRPRT